MELRLRCSQLLLKSSSPHSYKKGEQRHKGLERLLALHKLNFAVHDGHMFQKKFLELCQIDGFRNEAVHSMIKTFLAVISHCICCHLHSNVMTYSGEARVKEHYSGEMSEREASENIEKYRYVSGEN